MRSDPAWGGREGWLSLLQEVFDPGTREHLDRLGVAPGWHVLEVGAGGGSIAAWLAHRVRPGGKVVATDVDTRYLRRLGEPELEVLEQDVLTDELPADSFDLVHCRAVLVHLPDRGRALARMAGWVKPGGTLLVEEPWVDMGLLSPDPVAVRATEALAETMDGGFARRLPLALREVGLEQVEADGKLRFFNGGTRLASFFRHALEGAAVPLVVAGHLGRDELRRMTARFEDPAWSDCGWPRITAWGRKPSQSAG